MDNQGTRTLTFAEYIREEGGSGVIYDDDCHETICNWLGQDWIHVDDYIAPIAHQVLVDAAEVHPKLYAKLMEVIVEAYCELRITLGPEPQEDTRPKLTRIK